MVRGRGNGGRGRGGNNGGFRNGGNGRNWNGNNGGNGGFNGGNNGGFNGGNNNGNNGNNRGNNNGSNWGNNNNGNNRGNNRGNHNAGNGNNNKNRNRKCNNNNQDNAMSSHRPPWADYVLRLLRDDTFDFATFRSLISAAVVMLALVWERRQRRGMTDAQIARELQLPMYACEQLKNLSQRAIEGTNQGPDAEGDVPMLDGNEQSENANLVVPELFVWDLFAQNFMNDNQNPPQPTNNN
jgi:hypothetical protein